MIHLAHLKVCPVFPANVDGLGAKLHAFSILLLLELDGRDVGEERHLLRIQLHRLRVDMEKLNLNRNLATNTVTVTFWHLF